MTNFQLESIGSYLFPRELNLKIRRIRMYQINSRRTEICSFTIFLKAIS